MTRAIVSRVLSERLELSDRDPEATRLLDRLRSVRSQLSAMTLHSELARVGPEQIEQVLLSLNEEKERIERELAESCEPFRKQRMLFRAVPRPGEKTPGGRRVRGPRALCRLVGSGRDVGERPAALAICGLRPAAQRREGGLRPDAGRDRHRRANRPRREGLAGPDPAAGAAAGAAGSATSRSTPTSPPAASGSGSGPRSNRSSRAARRSS